MIEINMQGALTIYSMSFLIGLLVMGIYYIFTSTHKTVVQNFLLFFFLSSVGALMIVLRVEIDNYYFSIIIANLSIYLGNVFLVFGIRKLYQLRTKYIVYIIYTAVYILGFVYFTYFDFNVIARVYIFNLMVIGILFKGILSIKESNLSKHKEVKELLTTSIIIIITFMFIRIGNIALGNESTNEFLSFTSDTLFVSLVGVSNLLIPAGIFTVIYKINHIKLLESERSKSSILSNLPGFAYRCLNDENWTMTFLSEGFNDLTGYKTEDVINNTVIPYSEVVCEEFRDSLYYDWNRQLEKQEPYIGEYKIRRKDGNEIWVWEQGRALIDENGNCYAIEGFVTNIDKRKNLEKNLEYLSYRDSLTELYNRRYVEEHIARLDVSRNIPISIIMGDINGLKFINDSFGHEYGDKLIKATSKILRSSIRGDEVIARLGGDEFLVILENTSREDAKQIVNRIQRRSARAVYSDMGLSIALGYATKTKSSQKLFRIRKEAEDMMYKEKMYKKPSQSRKTVDAMLKTLFEKDEMSEIHSRNVSTFSRKLAEASNLSESDISLAETAGLLHDIGKIIIEAKILTSKSKLSDEEYEQIKQHPEIGYRILSSVPELKETAQIILSHHERVDGKGYPNQLEGKDIPIISRIITICDAFDAMTKERTYRKSFTKEEAMNELIKCKGSQFDAELVEKFITIIK